MLDLKKEMLEINHAERKISLELFEADKDVYQTSKAFLKTPEGLKIYKKALRLRKLHYSILETIVLFDQYNNPKK